MKYFIGFLFFSVIAFSSDTQEEVTIKYKQSEYFDFSALEVKGEILTPTDINIQTNRRVRFNIEKHIRGNFDDYIQESLIDIH